MQVSNDGDLELETSGPSRRLDVIARNIKPQLGLDTKTVCRGRGAESTEPGKETKELAARDHEWLIVMHAYAKHGLQLNWGRFVQKASSRAR
ncbi:hypothetical protein [Bradyrhizobium lablabi]|uniref:hypothetical protein n=1 Tax=Bradyrhizobium lablabi TaxID=722472 RepID=UPI001FCDB3C0|nr:hypothetical protein [Bradyrhizobium lablabi]